MKMFAIFDTQVGAYMTPFFQPTVGVAVRTLGDMVNRGDQNSPIVHHPMDFVLFDLGTFDEKSCKFDLLDAPTRVVVLSELKSK